LDRLSRTPVFPYPGNGSNQTTAAAILIPEGESAEPVKSSTNQR
jgi:hypothetical protein